MMIKERKPESGAELYRKLQKENHELADCNARLLDQVGAATKRTIELEKENEQLKSAAEFQQSSNMKRHFEIQELKKENAELKAEIENDRDLPTVAYMHGAEKQKKKDEKQLTKAKEILKMIVNYYPCYNKTITEQAEQFLKEIEK